MNEIYELGKSIRKQLIRKNAKHHIVMLGNSITGGASDEISLEYLMKMISGYELEVDLSPLAKSIENEELHTGLQMLLAGLLSK